MTVLNFHSDAHRETPIYLFVTEPFEIDWAVTTWEGDRRRQHAEFRALPFRERLLLIEQMEDLANRFRRGMTSAESAHRPIEPLGGDDR